MTRKFAPKFIEPVLIIAATCLVVVTRSSLPPRMEVGYILVALGLVFLLQTLIRDLVIMKTQVPELGKSESARCMCVETFLGFAPLILAIMLISAGFRSPMELPAAFWPAAVLLVMVLSYIVKDLVIDLKTLQVRRHPNHMNIIFKWNPE